jgi:hypothetical protein
MASEDPGIIINNKIVPVSCGLPNPCHFYVLPKEQNVDRALRVFPHTARYYPTSCLVGRQHKNYLRTVIVTAAVYRGFGRELRPPCGELTLFLNLPAPGRRQTLYIHLRVSRVLCF